jgi:hypothetical protein
MQTELIQTRALIRERADTSRFPTILIHQEVWLGDELLHSWHGPTARANASEACKIVNARIDRGLPVTAPRTTCIGGVQLPLL